MNTDQQTEQPIPADFIKWVKEESSKLWHSSADITEEQIHIAETLAYRAYRHLHSLPPSPVGEAVPVWVKAIDRLPKNGNYNARYAHNRCVLDIREGKVYEIRGLAHIVSYVDVELEWLEWLDESPTPSRAAEISPVLPRWVNFLERIPSKEGDYYIKISYEWQGEMKNEEKMVARFSIDHFYIGPFPVLNEKNIIEWLEEATQTPAPEIKDFPVEQKDRHALVVCPSCGKGWDTVKYNACSCGALLKAKTHEIVLHGKKIGDVPDPKGEIPESPAEYISRSTAEAQEIPEEIVEIARQQAAQDAGQKEETAREVHIEGYVNGAIAVFDKMTVHNAAVFHRLITAHAERVDSLTQQRDQLGAEIIQWTLRLEEVTAKRNLAKEDILRLTKSLEEMTYRSIGAKSLMEAAYEEKYRAINNEQKLIDDLKAKSDEAVDYWVLMNDIANGAYHISEPLQERAQQLVNKYKSAT